MKYEITKELETGNRVIDEEHRTLFDRVNQLMDACSAGKGRASVETTLKFMLDYVDQHFAHEEELQKRNGYPNFTAHHAFHEGYEKKLRDVAAHMSLDAPTISDVATLNQQIGVLISHIRTEDKNLGAYLREKGN